MKPTGSQTPSSWPVLPTATAARLAELGALTRANTVAEFAAFRETQIAFFAEMVKTANIRIE